MKKKYILILFVFWSVLASAQTSVWDGRREVWCNGAGTESNPYLIESAGNLASLAYMVNKGYETEGLFFRLTVDLDLGGEGQSWEPIGLGDRWANEDGCDRGILETGSSFKGHFDGGGHLIFNLYVEESYTNAGLFGYVAGQNDSPAVIENVFVASGTIQGNNCGGIVGNGSFMQVSCCWNGAEVEGRKNGGIMGLADNATINNCYNAGNILGIGDNTVAGGLVGFAQNTVQLTNSYNVGGIFSTNQIGCLVGDGVNGTMTVENCHYLSACSQSECGLPQDETFMQSMDFVNLLNGQNEELAWAFDVDNINNGFPILAEVVCLVGIMPNPDVGGIVQGGGAYSYGSSCTVIAEVSPHYDFVNWTENDEVISEEDTCTFVVTANRDLVANFILESHAINVSMNMEDAGVVTGSGSYSYGSNCTVVAEINPHYVFVNWTENGEVVSEEETYTFVVATDRDLVANFMLESHEITLEANPLDAGIVMGAGTYHFGDTVTLNVVPNDYYVFQYWTENGEVVSETETYSFVVEDSRHLVADFIFYDGVSDMSSSIMVFPNPAYDVLFVEGEDVRKVAVLNLMGQVLDVVEGHDHLEISLGKYSSGVYIVKAQLKNSCALVRFVKL